MNQSKTINTIGIVGGVGPFAGLDLFREILIQTNVKKDQHHLPISLLSVPEIIPDRTEFLLGLIDVNPADAIIAIINQLVRSGSTVISIPCNTAHSPPIFDRIKAKVSKQVVLLNMIDEVAKYIKIAHSNIGSVGVLSTTGSYHVNIYDKYLSKQGIRTINVDQNIQNNFIEPAIYSDTFGAKTNPLPTNEKALKSFLMGIEYLQSKGAEAIILGCSEIPLVLSEIISNKEILFINPTEVLALATIKAFNCLV